MLFNLLPLSDTWKPNCDMVSNAYIVIYATDSNAIAFEYLIINYCLFQNSDRLEVSQYFQFVGGNLRIQGLMSSDSGYFQCIGENSVGTVYGTAQLIVLDEGRFLS